MYSVIIPTAKASQTIEFAIKSVMRQSIPPAEVLVVLNNSDDETFVKIEKLKRQFHELRLLEYVTDNISDAMNFGITHANTSIIMRMDADDIMNSNRAELQLELLTRGADLVGGSIQSFGSSNSNWIVHKSDAYLKTLALFSSPLPSPTLAFKNNENLQYVSGYNHCEDMAFLLSAIRAGFILAGVKTKILRYRVHPGSMTVDWQKQKLKSLELTKLRMNLLNEHWDCLLSVGPRTDFMKSITKNNLYEKIAEINLYDVHPSYILRRLVSDCYVRSNLASLLINRVQSYLIEK